MRVFSDVNELINKFDYEICFNSIIYIKGSNAVGLNRFINHIKNNITMILELINIIDANISLSFELTKLFNS